MEGGRIGKDCSNSWSMKESKPKLGQNQWEWRDGEDWIKEVEIAGHCKYLDIS